MRNRETGRLWRTTALVLLASALVCWQAHGQTGASEGAEGFGAVSSGGTGGRVIEVTNLEHQGVGSLRAALAAEGPRIVTFKVAGTIDTPQYYWASVFVAEPLTPDEYKEVAKSIGDEHFRGRFGQVHVFDDEWARDMELPENQHIELSDEEAARWQQHHVMSYVHDGKGYWFDR